MIRQYCALRGILRSITGPFILPSVFSDWQRSPSVLKRALEGNASSEQAYQVGALTPLLAKLGLDIAMNGED